jgi:hypothetical protein
VCSTLAGAFKLVPVRLDGLAVRSEQVVYEVVMGCVRREATARNAWLGEALGAVRMAPLPPAYLARTVGVDRLVMESLDALRIVAEANRDSHSSGAERAVAETGGPMRKRKRASGGELKILMVVGGHGIGYRALQSAAVYDGSTGKWWALPEMSVPRCGRAAVGTEGNVYVVGGDGVKSAEMYDGSARQ